MEAIRKLVTVEDNHVTVKLPSAYNGTQVELIILPVKETTTMVNEVQVDYFSKHYGSIKSRLKDNEIDEKLKALREEWNRDI
jgi:hypothetical protein